MYDSPIMTKLSALATCLCAQIAADGLPEPCFCGLVPGGEVLYEYITGCKGSKCGMAYVRLSATAPISGIGVPNIAVDNCGSDLGFDVEVGILRCAPIQADRTGRAPTEDQWLSATDLQIADMMAAYKAIACCEALGDFIIEPYTPVGPEGLAVGGFWTVSAGAL